MNRVDKKTMNRRFASTATPFKINDCQAREVVQIATNMLLLTKKFKLGKFQGYKCIEYDIYRCQLI